MTRSPTYPNQQYNHYELQRKQERAQEEQRNIAAGNPGDVDFIGLVRRWRKENLQGNEPHESDADRPPRICIAVRKRPMNEKELQQKLDHDSVTCIHPSQVWVHNAKLKVDGITKYLDHTSFTIDYAFNEMIDTASIYQHTTLPLVNFVCQDQGRATVFAYGQTGSGKTYTMQGIQELVARDLFASIDDEQVSVSVAFFEIYGGYIQDLLNERNKLKVLEDGKGEIVVNGLEEYEADDPDQFHGLVEKGNQ